MMYDSNDNIVMTQEEAKKLLGGIYCLCSELAYEKDSTFIRMEEKAGIRELVDDIMLHLNRQTA